MRNPTVTIEVTERELRVLTNLLGYSTHCITLRDKLSDAGSRMRLAKREKNRLNKAARLAKQVTP